MRQAPSYTWCSKLMHKSREDVMSPLILIGQTREDKVHLSWQKCISKGKNWSLTILRDCINFPIFGFPRVLSTNNQWIPYPYGMYSSFRGFNGCWMLIGQVCGGPSKQRDSRPNNQLAILLTLAKEGELERLLKIYAVHQWTLCLYISSHL